jgi:hypothetical protein
MSALLVHCPLTGRKIDTGVDTDEYSLSRVGSARLRVECPHCGKSHRIVTEDRELDRAAAVTAFSANP